MASFSFGAGVRDQALAKALWMRNPEADAETIDSEAGIRHIARLSAPVLTISRAMVSAAYFSGKPEYEESVDMILQHKALTAEGKVLVSDRERAVVADDDADKMMSLRMKAHHQAAIARLSGKLGLSRNDFVLRAIDHYVRYLDEIESMEG